MFSSKLNLKLNLKVSASNVSLKSYSFKEWERLLPTLSICHYNSYTCKNVNHLYIPHSFPNIGKNKLDTNYRQVSNNISTLLITQKFSTKEFQKKDENFGELSDNLERLDLNEGEQEDEIEETWERPSKYDYHILVHKIQEQIKLGKVKAALHMLNEAEKTNFRFNETVYNEIIKEFSSRGDIKQCFKLYNNMKKRRLVPNDMTYNELINACARSENSSDALKHLNKLRQYFHKNNKKFNVIQYSCLVKSYCWHNELLLALEVADEMRDNRVPFTEYLFNGLFVAASREQDKALKYAISIWYLMRRCAMKPTTSNYNNILLALRETKFNNIGNIAISELAAGQIQINDNCTTDVLNFPPKISKSILVNTQSQNTENESEQTACIKSEINALDTITLSSRLNQILKYNRLALFGGYENILKRMEKDGAEPNAITMTRIMELLPSMAEEEAFIRYARQKKLPIDDQFLNRLIRKRNFNGEYEGAKAVLGNMQEYCIQPNIMTFGVLALGCKTTNEALSFLQQLESIRVFPNSEIMHTLLKQAFYKKDFKYATAILNYMFQNNMRPSIAIMNTIESFEKYRLQLTKRKDPKYTELTNEDKEDMATFEIQYKLILRMREKT